MPLTHEIHITDAYGRLIDAYGHGEWIGFDVTRIVNQTGTCAFRLPYVDRWRDLYQMDHRISIQSRNIEGGPQRVLNDTVYPIAGQVIVNDTPKEQSITLECPDLNILAEDRGIPHFATSAETDKSGPADDVLKALIRENVASTATDALGSANRGLLASILTVENDRGQAPSIDLACAWRPDLLRVLQEVAAMSRDKGMYLAFDFVARPDRPIQFQTFVNQRGRDRRNLTLSRSRGTLSSIRATIDYRQAISIVYAAGRGENTDRGVALMANLALLSRSPFGWRERIINPSSTIPQDIIDQTPILEDAARAELAMYTLRPAYVAQFSQTGAVQYHEHVRFGDRVTAEGVGATFPARLDAVVMNVTAEGDSVNVVLSEDDDT